MNEQGTFEVPSQVNADQAMLSLMAMAESFRNGKPRRYKMAIKCVMAALKIRASRELTALCNYELGKLLWLYTRNIKLAIFYLKKAYNMMKELGTPLELARLKVVCLLSEIYVGERYYDEIKALLRNEIADSRKHPLLHAKMLLLFGEVYSKLGDYDRALEVINSGINYFRDIKEVVVECYFRLTKSLILSIQMTNQQELGNSVSELGEIIQNVSSSVPSITDLRAFCYSIQLCYFLSTGMLKNSKQCLRQLHKTVQAIETQVADSNPHFYWLSQDMLTGFAYVLTVLSNIQYSNFERAHRYFATALQHFEKLRTRMRQSSWPVVERRDEEFIGQLEALLYEAVSQTQLILGNPRDTLNNISCMVKIVRNLPTLMQDFESQIHTLLGMYACFIKQLPIAERQFKAAARTTNDTELLSIVHLSLAVVYMFQLRDADFYELFEYISPLKLKSGAISLKSMAHFVQAIHYYLHMRTDECRNHLMESIPISKEEEMIRLQAMSLLLLSKTFRCRDADMLNAACEWANKSGDGSLLIWANSQIIQLHTDNGQVDEAAHVKLANDAHMQRIDAERQACAQMPQNRLVEWCDGSVDAYFSD